MWTWGRGVKKGWTSTFGKKIEVQYCLVTKSFFQGERLFDGEEKSLS